MQNRTYPYFRGDAKKIEHFDPMQSSGDTLFGKGLYLTSSREIAKDYAFNEGVNCDFFAPKCRTEREAVKAYIRRIMNDELKLSEQKQALHSKYSHMLYGMQQSEEDFEERHDRINQEYREALRHLQSNCLKKAKRTFEQRIDNLGVAFDSLGNSRFTTRDQAGYISSFEIPQETISHLLDGDRPIPDHLIIPLAQMFKECGQSSFRHGQTFGLTFEEWVSKVRHERDHYAWSDHDFGGLGKNPSLDEIKNGTHVGISVFHHSDHQDTLIRHLRAQGYEGIKFRGGTPGSGTMPRGGGGFEHEVIVLWDSKLANSYRKNVEPLSPMPLNLSEAKHIRFSSLGRF